MGETHTTGRASLDTATASRLVVALLVVVAMGASVPVFAGTAAAAGTTDIDVSPADVETTTGETQTFTVTVPNASDGVSAYDFNVSVGDPAVAEITSIDDRTGLDDTNVNTEIAADGATANINAFGANEPAGSVEVIAVTVEFVDAGSTTLDVTVNALGDNTQQVNAYTIDEVTQPTIDVSDIEVGLEPTSQTATVGEDRTYDIVAESVTDGLGYFDLTVASSNTTVGPITAGEANAPINSTTIADDNTSAQFGGVYNASASTDPTVTLGTVTVDAEAAGNTDLTLDITEVGDSNGDEYTIIEGPDADLTVEAPADDGDGDGDGGDGDGGDGDGGDGTDGDDGDDGTDGGDGDGGDGGGADDGADITPPEAPADVDVVADETAALEVDDETDTTTVTFGEDNAVVSVTFDFRASGSVNARTLSATPNETGPAPGASAVVSQITVGSVLRDSDATVRKRVTRDRLSELGADAEDLTAYRFADGEWQALDTEVADENDQRVVLEFETPGFSYFAVSATGEPTAAIDAPSEVEAGSEVTLDASGSETEFGEIVSYDWSVGGESLSGETATTTLDEAGDVSVELTVENDAGETDTASATVTVTQVDDGDDGDGDGTGDGTGDDGEGTDDSTPGFGILVTLVALIVSLGYLTRRT